MTWNAGTVSSEPPAGRMRRRTADLPHRVRLGVEQFAPAPGPFIQLDNRNNGAGRRHILARPAVRDHPAHDVPGACRGDHSRPGTTLSIRFSLRMTDSRVEIGHARGEVD